MIEREYKTLIKRLFNQK